MFKKIPYGVKVRVRGNDEIGYIAEYAIYCSRFLPFMDDWTVIKDYRSSDTFTTQEAAQKAAMAQYNSWISFYKRKDKEKKLKRKLANSRTIWEHP
jgi:hypothetical protein